MSDEVTKLLQRMKEDNIQFVRFEAPSITGTAIGMLVPTRNCETFLRKGFPFCAIALMQTANTSMDLDVMANTGFRNVPCFADSASYTVIPWQDVVPTVSLMMAQPAKYHAIYPPDVRSVALKQLKLLNNVYKLNFLLSIEHEFVLLDKKNGAKPISLPGCYHLQRLSKYTEFFAKVDQNLRKMGIEVDRVHSEVASGQYEITALPAFNIKGADNAYWIRNAVQEMAEKYLDCHATFVTHLYSETGAGFSVVEDDSGAHFNFSLFDDGSSSGNGQKNNVLWDETKADLSDTALYFVGGVIEHCRALTAFCCPTSICYATRFDSPWVSTQGNWGKYNRTALIRVKPSVKNTHFEFRLPSSLANPYLVLAGVICAGCDGLKRKVLPPKETRFDMVDEKERMQCFQHTLPATLTEALDALNEDALFSESFGALFVRQYIATKRLEVKEMKDCERKKMKPLCYSLL